MYTNFEDRPECPVCKKKLQLHKIVKEFNEHIYWYCDCIKDMYTNEIEPDVVHFIDSED